jgi:hypothetical protein
MRPIVYCLLLSIAFFACKKNKPTPIEGTITYPVKLVSTTYQLLSTPQLFTKDGEIKDAVLLASHINRNFEVKLYSDLKVKPVFKDTITYLSKDTVQFSWSGIWGKRIPKKVGDYTYFYTVDTLRTIGDMNQGTLAEVFNNLGIQKPYHTNACSTSEVNCGQIKTYEAFIATGNTTQIIRPYLSVRLTRGSHYNLQSIQSQVNNVFDPASISFMQAGDTLLIQKAQVTYNRQ